jgi:hypothetical protein
MQLDNYIVELSMKLVQINMHNIYDLVYLLLINWY